MASDLLYKSLDGKFDRQWSISTSNNPWVDRHKDQKHTLFNQSKELL